MTRSMRSLGLVAAALALTLAAAACGDDTPEPTDTTKPTLTLTATPVTLTGGGTVTLSGAATDNVAVTSVSFYKGDTLLNKDTTLPYEATDTLAAPTTDTTVQYRAVAADAAGNTAEQTVTVTSKPAAPAALPNLTVRFSKGFGDYAFPDTAAPGRTVTLFSITNSTNTYTKLTTGTIGNDYRLTLNAIPADTLNAQLQSFPSTLPAGCTGTFTVSSSTLKYVEVGRVMVDTTNLTLSGESAMNIFNPDGTAPDRQSAYGSTGPNTFYYANEAGSVTGKFSCTSEYGVFNAEYALQLKKGWNFVQSNYTQAANGGPSSMTYKTLAATDVILAPSGPF